MKSGPPLWSAPQTGPGNVVTLEVDTGEVCEIFTGFGEINVTSAQVGHQVARETKEFIESDVPVGKHLADPVTRPDGHGRGRIVQDPRTDRAYEDEY